MTTEVWLYGSVARGTDQPASDVDVLVVTDEPSRVELPIELPRTEKLSVRTYSWSAVEQMAAYGSLFLLHVKLEGRALGDSSRLRSLLRDLPPYSRSGADVEGFRIGLDDARDSLLDGGSAAFELSVIATVVRHCSILACYLLGTPLFDRTESISTAFGAVGMSDRVDGALDLHKYRLAEARGIEYDGGAEAGIAMEWESVARRFVDRVGGLTMSAAAGRGTR